MFAKLELTRMAQSLAAHAGARLGTIAQNVANADTPSYKSRGIAAFAEHYVGPNAMRTSRDGHIQNASDRRPETHLTGGSQSVNGNDVSLEMEMVKSAQAREDHEMALAVQRATSTVLRASLGRY